MYQPGRGPSLLFLWHERKTIVSSHPSLTDCQNICKPRAAWTEALIMRGCLQDTVSYFPALREKGKQLLQLFVFRRLNFAIPRRCNRVVTVLEEISNTRSSIDSFFILSFTTQHTIPGISSNLSENASHQLMEVSLTKLSIFMHRHQFSLS